MQRFSILLLAATLVAVNGYNTFQDRIPNGHKVPNPCDPSLKWPGVGHQNINGGGDRNPFGTDFALNEFVWSQKMCTLDSDGDGVTNGAELGDPDCIWSTRSYPTSDPLSHPGICEPLDSPQCQGKNDFLDCSTFDKGFECDAMNEPGVIELEARLTETVVPAKETTYMCQSFTIDPSQDYHMVAAKPIIDNANVLHHMVLYGCSDDTNVTHLNTPQDCFMETVCQDFLFVWAFGGDGTCLHKDAGFRAGIAGYKHVVMEMHWNNPFEVSTYTDSSGLMIYMVPNNGQRQDAGVMMIGDSLLVIPPGKDKSTVNGTCASRCTENEMQGPVNIFGVFNHMHFLGHSMVSELHSSSGETTVLGIDEKYDYNTPKYTSYDDPKVAYPGDDFFVQCNFNSTSRNKTTFWGYGSSDEMCFTFLTYFPRKNWGSSCLSYGPIAQCDFEGQQVVNGCDLDYTNPLTEKGSKVFADVNHNCLTSICLEECKSIVRELKKKNPCFQYPNRYIFQENGYLYVSNDSGKLYLMTFYYKLDSCNAELARDEGRTPGGGDWPPYSSGTASISGGFLFSLVALFVMFM